MTTTAPTPPAVGSAACTCGRSTSWHLLLAAARHISAAAPAVLLTRPHVEEAFDAVTRVYLDPDAAWTPEDLAAVAAFCGVPADVLADEALALVNGHVK